ncbi:MAG: family 10 glycosylhydrolase [Lachnospiraceae bacterium]
MKKRKQILALILSFVMLLGTVNIVSAAGLQIKVDGQTKDYTDSRLKATVNGIKVDLSKTPGLLEDGYAMMPYKALFVNSDLLVSSTYDKSTATLTLGYGTNKVVMTLGSKNAYVNGNKKTMPVAPHKVQYVAAKKTVICVPSRFVADGLGIGYYYNSEAQTVELTGAMNETASGLILRYAGKTRKYTRPETKTTLNGIAVSSTMPGILIGDTNMVSARAIFGNSAIAATVKYSKMTKTLNITKGDKTIKMTLGAKKATVNGKSVKMPAKALKVVNVKTKYFYYMVPAQFVTEALGYKYQWDNQNATANIIAKGITVSNSADSSDNTEQGQETILKVNGTKVSMPISGLLIQDVNMVSAKYAFAKTAIGATYKYDSSTKVVNLTYGSKTVKMMVGSKKATVNGVTKVMPAKVVKRKNQEGKTYIMVPAQFVAESLGFTYTWVAGSNTAKIKGEFATDTNANHTDDTNTIITTEEEVRGMWISYLDFSSNVKTEEEFQNMVNTMFDRCVECNMNAVIVQVRPFADALYSSQYYPWSEYASGTQGADPGYDPLAYMVEAAHARELDIHAWLNPYRVTGTYSGSVANAIGALSEDNQARIWYESDDDTRKRNVLAYNKQIYFNPASSDVQKLVVNGVKEIVTNYKVDGIHFDDYFYPTFSTSNVETSFDAQEYETYVEEASGTPMTIAQWRRNNVNTLVKKVHKAIKNINKECRFGISPAANLTNLRSDLQYYVDVDTWVQSDSYVDYICPQIYWGFENGAYSYDVVLSQWTTLLTGSPVSLYVGIPAYKAGTNNTAEWADNNDILKRQIETGRKSGGVSGYFFYRYGDFNRSTMKKELKNLLNVLK